MAAETQSVPGEAPYRDADRPGMLMLRLHEIGVGLVHAPRPMLVATPTSTTGLLAPETLLERLALAAAQHWQPWPHTV